MSVRTQMPAVRSALTTKEIINVSAMKAMRWTLRQRLAKLWVSHVSHAHFLTHICSGEDIHKTTDRCSHQNPSWSHIYLSKFRHGDSLLYKHQLLIHSSTPNYNVTSYTILTQQDSEKRGLFRMQGLHSNLFKDKYLPSFSLVHYNGDFSASCLSFPRGVRRAVVWVRVVHSLQDTGRVCNPYLLARDLWAVLWIKSITLRC